MNNQDLCLQAGIAIYRVGDVYQHNSEGVPISLEDQNKWFVSALDGLFEDSLIKSIPLSLTKSDAESLAVSHLGLMHKKGGLSKIKCPRCGGSGSYSFNLRRGTVCFRCEGVGTIMADVKKLLKQKLLSESRRKLRESERDARVAEGNRKIEEREARYKDDPRIGPETRAKCSQFPMVAHETYLCLELFDVGKNIHISCVTRLAR